MSEEGTLRKVVIKGPILQFLFKEIEELQNQIALTKEQINKQNKLTAETEQDEGEITDEEIKALVKEIQPPPMISPISETAINNCTLEEPITDEQRSDVTVE